MTFLAKRSHSSGVFSRFTLSSICPLMNIILLFILVGFNNQTNDNILSSCGPLFSHQAEQSLLSNGLALPFTPNLGLDKGFHAV